VNDKRAQPDEVPATPASDRIRATRDALREEVDRYTARINRLMTKRDEATRRMAAYDLVLADLGLDGDAAAPVAPAAVVSPVSPTPEIAGNDDDLIAQAITAASETMTVMSVVRSVVREFEPTRTFSVSDVITLIRERHPKLFEGTREDAVSTALVRLRGKNEITLYREGKGRRAALYVNVPARDNGGDVAA
jgi:hypothetical protein